MSRALVIVGTDTEVGKTYVTGRLCRVLREAGTDCGVYKPVQSGSPSLDHPDSDAARLHRQSGVPEAVAELCAFSYPEPLAPPIAARRAGPDLTLAALLAATRAVMPRHELTLIETAGGLLSPTAADGTVADFAVALGAPVLVVARAGLGTVNHTLLTLEAIRNRNLDCRGVVLNGAVGALAESDNPAMIESFGRTSVLAVIGKNATAAEIAKLANSLRW